MSKKKKQYSITNYGNTRSVYVKGQTWEIPRNGHIETDNSEVAAMWNDLLYVDVELIEQPSEKKSEKKSSKHKKKTSKSETSVRRKKKKKVTATTKNRKKIKRLKKKGRRTNE